MNPDKGVREMDNDKGKLPKFPTVLKDKKMLWVLGGLGLLLLLNPLAWFQTPESPKEPTAVGGNVTINTERESLKTYEDIYEGNLRDILNLVAGVSDVEVMVTIDSSEERIMAQNTQKRQQETREDAGQSGQRGITQIDEQGQIVMVSSHGSDQPVVTKTIKPTVRGVIVVAKGAEQIRIQALIKEAVERALDVPPHKISVLPRK